MSRLIDADKLINDIRGSDDAALDVIESFLDLQPTAYDVEKVLEELNKSLYDTNTYGACDDIETIVKRGGEK